MKPVVSIVIATLGRHPYLKRCLEGIREHSDVPHEVVLVTTAENRNALIQEGIGTEPETRFVLEDKPNGCVRAYNLGFKSAIPVSDFIVHLNDDCEVTPRWLSIGIDYIAGKDAMLAYFYRDPNYDKPTINSVWGMLYANYGLIPKSFMQELGVWDERFTHYSADPDFSLRVWYAGHGVIATPDAQIIHHYVQDGIRKEELREPDSERLKAKWRGIFVE